MKNIQYSLFQFTEFEIKRGKSLFYACKHGLDEQVLAHLQLGLNINTKNYAGHTPLMWATKFGHISTVQLLLGNGAEVSGMDDFNALHIAAELGFTDIAKILIAAGCDVQEEDKHGNTAFHYAVWNSHASTIQLLIENDVDFDAEIFDDGKTALHIAAGAGDIAIMTILLDLGADLGATDEYFQTPLHDAVIEGQEQAVALLLSRDADIEAEDMEGATPLHRAAEKGNAAIMQHLLNSGADIEAKDGNGETPIIRAARHGHLGTIHMLIDLEASVEYSGDDERVKTMLNPAMEKQIFQSSIPDVSGNSDHAPTGQVLVL